MLVEFVITDKLPLPARTVLNAVMIALKVKRNVAEELIYARRVTLKGRGLTQPHVRLEPGDRIAIESSPENLRKPKLLPISAADFEVLHLDQDLLVVNKPAGMLTVPTPRGENNTLQARLRNWLKQQRHDNTLICVHRLDKLVSGVLVFARSFDVAEQLREQFADRKPERVYRAFVSGIPQRDQGTIESYLSTDQNLNRRSSSNPQHGELAITHYQVEQVWDDVALLAVRLATGRRNQIRVHMANLGHPILGDDRYGADLGLHQRCWPYRRIALHAEVLGLEHPSSRHRLQFSAAWPTEFRFCRKTLQEGSQT